MQRVATPLQIHTRYIPAHNTMRPLDVVDVLEQLPPDVVGTMFLGQLDGNDIRSFKLVAQSTLALVRRAGRVLHLGRPNGQDSFASRVDLESQAEILGKYHSRMEVQLDVQSDAGISPLLVGVDDHSPREQ